MLPTFRNRNQKKQDNDCTAWTIAMFHKYGGRVVLGVMVLIFLVTGEARYSMEDYTKHLPSSKTLLANHKAIQTHIQSDSPPMDFQMLLFPLDKDRYLSKKLLERPITYEMDLSSFINCVLEPPASSLRSSTIKQHYWAVDVGANVGYHTLHMASMGTARVISFEPAPDTGDLLSANLALDSGIQERVILIRKGVADGLRTTGTMQRHDSSPGLTTFASSVRDNVGFKMHNVTADEASNSTVTLPLVAVEEVLEQHGLPEAGKIHKAPTPARLRFIKIDVEGFEVLALRGLNLQRYPFEYINVEYFPSLIEGSGISEAPSYLLEFLIVEHGYKCLKRWPSDRIHASDLDLVFADESLNVGDTVEAIQEWAVTVHQGHANVFCKSSKPIVGL